MAGYDSGDEFAREENQPVAPSQARSRDAPLQTQNTLKPEEDLPVEASSEVMKGRKISAPRGQRQADEAKPAAAVPTNTPQQSENPTDNTSTMLHEISPTTFIPLSAFVNMTGGQWRADQARPAATATANASSSSDMMSNWYQASWYAKSATSSSRFYTEDSFPSQSGSSQMIPVYKTKKALEKVRFHYSIA